MYFQSSGRGRYVADEDDSVCGDLRTWMRQPTQGVIYCHGSGETAQSAINGARFLMRSVGRFFTIHVGDLGFQNWGGPTGVQRVEQAVAYLRSNWNVSGKVALIGGSMGGATALAYTYAHPEEVSCVAGVVPLTNIATVRANPYIASRWPEIDAIYGSPPDADYDGHSPITFATELPEDLPIRIWSSTDDPLTTRAMHEEFIAARPQTEMIDLGAVSHNFPNTPENMRSLTAFLTRHHTE